jgi:hypothetical protein
MAGLLAVIPHLIGFHPSKSLVVVGLDGPRDRVRLAFRYDLPDPPDTARSREIAEHVVAVLGRRQISTVVAAGYGTGTLVTPVAQALRAALRGASVTVRDLLRVEDGRFWSYKCQDPGCCPPEGRPFDASQHPYAAALDAAGMTVCRDRGTLAATLAPVTGQEAQSMRRAELRALRRARDLIGGSGAPAGSQPLTDAGRAAVREAIALYRRGGQITDDDQMAWLIVTVADIRVRDDAWARMDPEHRAAHRRLWTDLVRRAREPFVPAPASLLAFTAWQSGDGALANIAVDRALAADPDYSMAHLIGEAVEAGLPPSAARLPMTPEEVEASYAESDRTRGVARATRRRGPVRGGHAARAR